MGFQVGHVLKRERRRPDTLVFNRQFARCCPVSLRHHCYDHHSNGQERHITGLAIIHASQLIMSLMQFSDNLKSVLKLILTSPFNAVTTVHILNTLKSLSLV